MKAERTTSLGLQDEFLPQSAVDFSAD